MSSSGYGIQNLLFWLLMFYKITRNKPLFPLAKSNMGSSGNLMTYTYLTTKNVGQWCAVKYVTTSSLREKIKNPAV